MILPELHGSLSCKDFFVFAACDQNYFAQFGTPLINSIKRNSENDIHLHLYNPTQSQINLCNDKGVSLTYEYAPIEIFATATQPWLSDIKDKEESLKKGRILNAMSKSDDKSIQERIQRTYYACARFIRLEQITQGPRRFFAIDSDALVRKQIPMLPDNVDFYIHEIKGPKARFLAGGIYSTATENSYNFLKEYAGVLKSNIEKDYLHWGIDQDVMNTIVPRYKYGALPLIYIDWNMHPSSVIWTAKGSRKDVNRFVAEKQKYAV